jgi:hypothetical protein
LEYFNGAEWHTYTLSSVAIDPNGRTATSAGVIVTVKN